jgi:homocysteine S-methyltransferase
MNHKKHIDLLIDSNVHFILNETQSHLDEIEIICKHCSQSNIPFVMSLYLDSSLRILSGQSFGSVLTFILEYAPLAIGVNCISPEIFNKIFELEYFNHNWGFYLNCGSGLPTDKNISCGVNPVDYLKTVQKSLNKQPSFIGSCCGSDPSHTKKIREYLDGKNSD